MIGVVPMYGGSIAAYAAMLRSGEAVIKIKVPLRRLWHFNHCRILTANGPFVINLPMKRLECGKNTLLSEVGLSDHGDWRRLHRGALFSAYGRAPYYEHLADELFAIIDGDYERIADIDIDIMRLIINFMQLPINIKIDENGEYDNIEVEERLAEQSCIDGMEREYWQVWRHRFGFKGGMSIVDLAMNEGPMAINTLRRI